MDILKTMQVRVLDRSGSDTSRTHLGVRKVMIGASCPRCGRARGLVRPHRFCQEGQWLDCDVWINDCGHVDYYEAIVKEAAALGRAKT